MRFMYIVTSPQQAAGPTPALLEAMQRAAAALVVADPADQIHFMPKFTCMRRKVQGRAPQVFGRSNHIPENFANADNAHVAAPLPTLLRL